MSSRQLDEEGIFHIARDIANLEFVPSISTRSAPVTRLSVTASRRCSRLTNKRRSS